MKLSIIKRCYSSNPWRLVTEDGVEVTLPANFDHPMLGRTTVSRPVMGGSKKVCTEEALALLGALLDKVAEDAKT